jgi:hypothetical protein
MQKKESIYETELFSGIVEKIKLFQRMKTKQASGYWPTI